MTHKVGDKLFVDFTGQKLQLVDNITGEINEVEVFVAILGCSQLTFVMAVRSQCKEDFILGCERNFLLYEKGGISNLKNKFCISAKHRPEQRFRG